MDMCEAILHLQYDCVAKDFVLSDQSDDKIRAQRVFYTNHLVLAAGHPDQSTNTLSGSLTVMDVMQSSRVR